jgi:hypothetical protein
MEDILTQVTDVLLALIGVGIGLRLVEIFVRMATNPDDAGNYKHKIRNLVVFAILAVSIKALAELIQGYYL